MLPRSDPSASSGAITHVVIGPLQQEAENGIFFCPHFPFLSLFLPPFFVPETKVKSGPGAAPPGGAAFRCRRCGNQHRDQFIRWKELENFNGCMKCAVFFPPSGFHNRLKEAQPP